MQLAICMLGVVAALFVVSSTIGTCLKGMSEAMTPETLPLEVEGHIKYRTTIHDLDVAQLRAAVRYAKWSIIAHSKFTKPFVEDSLYGLLIVVKDADWWEAEDGSRVTCEFGENHAIIVGRNLSGLCHALLHHLEVRYEGKPDRKHRFWFTRHLFLADHAYRMWLTGALL